MPASEGSAENSERTSHQQHTRHTVEKITSMTPSPKTQQTWLIYSLGPSSCPAGLEVATAPEMWP